jgi:vitamin B12 transporter
MKKRSISLFLRLLTRQLSVKMRYFVSCCLVTATLFSISTSLSGQKLDTTLFLPILEINSQRIKDYNDGYRIETPDSSFKMMHQSSTLGEMLADFGDIFIRNYGPGSIATSSFRGGNASHTAVLWNGLNIQSATLGQTDFSIIPAIAFDNVNIRYGGASALWGSGAVGGSIHLNSENNFNQGIRVATGMETGQFGHLSYHTQVAYSNKWYSGRILFNKIHSENEFTYINRAKKDHPIDTLRHASFSQRTMIQDHRFILATHHQVSIHLWYSEHDRNIPPSMTQSSLQRAEQHDLTTRLGINYTYSKNKFSLFYRSGYFDEQLTYYNHQNDSESPSQFYAIIQELEGKIKFNPYHQINVGVNFTNFNAITSGYPERINQWRLAGFMAYKFSSKNDKLQSSFSIRQETLEDQLQPITASFGTKYKLTNQWSLNGNVNRSYRLPTLNDLFWSPGGNPDLKPEIGWGQELFFSRIAKPTKTGQFTYNLGGFNRNMKNWIIWIPTNGIWTAQNIRDVHSYGLEAKMTHAVKIRNIDWNTRISASYTRSINLSPISDNDNSANKQLIYTPPLSWSIFTSLHYKGLSLSYSHNYRDIRYTSTDNSSYLPAYQLGDLRTSYSLKLKHLKSELFFAIRNLWNEQYEIMLWRPMPGRHYRMGVNVWF